MSYLCKTIKEADHVYFSLSCYFLMSSLTLSGICPCIRRVCLFLVCLSHIFSPLTIHASSSLRLCSGVHRHRLPAAGHRSVRRRRPRLLECHHDGHLADSIPRRCVCDVCVDFRAVRRLLRVRFQARVQNQGLRRFDPRPRRHDGSHVCMSCRVFGGRFFGCRFLLFVFFSALFLHTVFLVLRLFVLNFFHARVSIDLTFYSLDFFQWFFFHVFLVSLL